MPKLMIDDLYLSMPWDELDAIVFDVGNVLLSFNPAAILSDLLPNCQALHPVLMKKIFQSPYWVMMDRGLLSCTEAAECMIGRDTALAEPIRHVMANWIEMKDQIEEGQEALRICKAHGKKLYVLSNYGCDSFAHVEKKYDFFKLFDGKVISAREKMMKPDLAIYNLLTSRYGLDPARTLFIDDSFANIEGALYAGWQGFCFNQPGKLHKFVTEC